MIFAVRDSELARKPGWPCELFTLFMGVVNKTLRDSHYFPIKRRLVRPAPAPGFCCPPVLHSGQQKGEISKQRDERFFQDKIPIEHEFLASVCGLGRSAAGLGGARICFIPIGNSSQRPAVASIGAQYRTPLLHNSLLTGTHHHSPH